ncbi:amino acid ABC transporter substrate-binding protein [Acinetobacter rathckeae]|uniref:amino acid ABC transporter substrate-binding protein n=1 Tax=Acinetobacter rathckeae TaxID=2605272 RepID=UPI0018A2EB52|nr:amino acid ABC transporter substrate-binding protein [Acinetobacter rathckeae]MBF7687853.1 amino acid ABC transporter substrate-binding protein [Acinetobacter rathckeae]MBF7687924.1 amino acid ABC transporter substrate-binding protein [Acinetobacter rathckeae]MBF7696023.1 amino acid ABC transporter substrate-binding protein [Acinetobacter rathckeae]
MKHLYLFTVVMSCGFFGGISQTYATDTLTKIKERGAIVIGHRDSSIPMSYTANGQVLGYAIDVCKSVVDVIKAEHHLPDLRVEYQVVNAKKRMSDLNDGKIDMECGSTIHTMFRQKQVDFSINYFVSEVRMLVRANSGLRSFADLNGRTVVTTEGVTADKYIKQNAKGAQIDVKHVYGQDDAESFAIFELGQADAFILDENALVGFIHQSVRPKRFEVVGPVLSVGPYGVMFAKDDARMKLLVDRVIISMWTSGQMDKLYKKWFLSAIPPQSLPLNLPKSESFKRLEAHPNDSGVI